MGLGAGDRPERGRQVAEALTGAWRAVPPPLASSQSLTEATPLLLESGAAGLGWWRARHSGPEIAGAAHALHQTYRLNTLRAAVQEREIAESVAHLRSAGVEPILGKGWAAARPYPALGLRPSGDIDLYVRAEQHATGRGILGPPEDAAVLVDLHPGFSDLGDRSPEELYRRSISVEVGGAQVRIFGPEDHLRLLCLHLLRHGAWRPLWLCDVAAALEARPPAFDWDYFGRGRPRWSHWVACVLGLAHQILGARLDGVPSSWRPDLPRWLVPTVLRQWEKVEIPHGRREPIAISLRLNARALEALRLRWPNGIEATVGMEGPFNNLPRLPFQIGDCLRRASGAVWRGVAPNRLRRS